MRASLAIAFCLLSAPTLHAGPLGDTVAGHWRSDTASLAAGGTLAPMPLIGEVRPEAPTSLPLNPSGEVAFELVRTTPFTWVQGNRYFVELRVDTRGARAAIPLGHAADRANWWFGWRLTSTRADLYHRDRWLDDRAVADGSASTLAVAWRDGAWTLGAARRDADLSGVATGSNLADILGIRRGHERVEFGWDGRLDTLAAQYESANWSAGAQHSVRDDTAHLALEVAGDPFTGIFANETRTFDAWVGHGPPAQRYFAFIIRSDTDPASSVIASGDAIRGRTSLSAESTVIGVCRRRAGDRATEHLELSWIEHSVEFSGRLSHGVLGSLDGQIGADASAGSRTIAARWGQTRHSDAFRWTLAASVMHTDLSFHGRAIDSPGPFLAPNRHREERLHGGGALVGSISVGAGWESEGWRTGAVYTLFGGDTWGTFHDLTDAERVSTSARIPPAPDTGPSPRLDLGWTFSLQVSRDL